MTDGKRSVVLFLLLLALLFSMTLFSCGREHVSEPTDEGGGKTQPEENGSSENKPQDKEPDKPGGENMNEEDLPEKKIIPDATSGEEKLTSEISCGEGNTMRTYENFSATEASDYLLSLADDGFSQVHRNVIAENVFTVYTKDAEKRQVETYWYPSKGIFKVIYGKTGSLPAFEKPNVPSVCTPTLTQPGRKAVDESAPNGAPGMNYVFQLSNGHYLIVDSGPNDKNGEDAGTLYDYLVAHKPEGETKPHIEMWIITHAHSDHTLMCGSFLQKYGSSVTIDAFAYNFPDFLTISMTEDATALNQIASAFKAAVKAYAPSAKQIILHTGMKFYVSDAEVEILFTPENHAPQNFPTGNHTSIAFRVRLGDKDVMILGDSEKSNCQFMAEVYGSVLKSDILQVTHHGVNGGYLALYQAIDPDICFWAIDEGRFQSHTQIRGAKAWDFNVWILDDSVRVRTHYSNSVTHSVSLRE